MEKHDDFIKIKYYIFTPHKPSINFFMKSSYAKDLNSVNTKSNCAYAI